MAEPAAPDALAELIRRAAAGHPPPADGAITVLRQPADALAGVLAFTGHHVVAADVDEAWVRGHLDHGDMSAPVGPAFVGALAAHLGRAFDNLDLVLATDAVAGPPGSDLVEVAPDPTHHRVARSLAFRTDVRTFVTPGDDGVIVIARGLAGRWEGAFEVDPAVRGRGMGRALAAAARRLVPEGETMFLQVSPGNVASLRAVLATGLYRPIGAEILFAPPP